MVIVDIVEKKSNEDLLVSYARKDFEKDFQESIDCSKLNLSKYHADTTVCVEKHR